MNRRLDYDLAKLAFGDLTDGQAQNARESIEGDPAAVNRLREYEVLRANLRSLRDVPPDQLSSERVREAILARGLKPGKTSLPFSWLAWGAGAAAFGLMLLTAMNIEVDRGTVPDKSSLVATGASAVPLSSDGFDLNLRSDWQVHEKSLDVPVAEVTPAHTEPTQPVVHGAARRTGSRNVAPQVDVTSDTSARRVVPHKDLAAGGLILISSEQDQATGARKAYEVESQGLEDVLVSS